MQTTLKRIRGRTRQNVRRGCAASDRGCGRGRQAFAAVQASVVHLQGVPLSKRFALVPLGPPLLPYSSTCKARAAPAVCYGRVRSCMECLGVWSWHCGDLLLLCRAACKERISLCEPHLQGTFEDRLHRTSNCYAVSSLETE